MNHWSKFNSKIESYSILEWNIEKFFCVLWRCSKFAFGIVFSLYPLFYSLFFLPSVIFPWSLWSKRNSRRAPPPPSPNGSNRCLRLKKPLGLLSRFKIWGSLSRSPWRQFFFFLLWPTCLGWRGVLYHIWGAFEVVSPLVYFSFRSSWVLR